MRIGIVGLGSIAHKHIAALRQIDPNIMLFALRHSPEKANSESGVENVYSHQDLLAQKLDFIIISNPTSMHRQTIEHLGSAGVPLMIEKPLFDTLEEPLPSIDTHSYVACNLRFLDCLKYVKQAIKGERINEVNAYCGSYLPEWREGAQWRDSYSANHEMGGGVHIDLIHEVDYVYWMFGQPMSIDHTFRNVSSLEITACDYANYTLQYEQFTASIVLNYYRRHYKRTLEVLTSSDTWEVDLARNTVTRNGVEVFASAQTIADTYVCQIRHFIDSISNGERFNDINQAYDVLKICLEK